ncbi:MAG: hypothetical protein COA69_14065 [Robiginitomaculum sp.]|nr:MAG: hypothetical protein COA69_14065 [Robiginitomaculum sp.]
MALIDTLIARRQKLLLIAALGFTMWQGGLLLNKMFPTDDTAHAIALAMTLTGAFQWAAFSIGFVHFSRKAKPEIEALNDELTRSNRAKSLMYGYMALLGAISLLFGLSTVLGQTRFPALNADFIIHGLLILAVVCPILCFFWLERSNA